MLHTTWLWQRLVQVLVLYPGGRPAYYIHGSHFCEILLTLFSLLHFPTRFWQPYITIRWHRVALFTLSGWDGPMYAMFSSHSNGIQKLAAIKIPQIVQPVVAAKSEHALEIFEHDRHWLKRQCSGYAVLLCSASLAFFRFSKHFSILQLNRFGQSLPSFQRFLSC